MVSAGDAWGPHTPPLGVQALDSLRGARPRPRRPLVSLCLSSFLVSFKAGSAPDAEATGTPPTAAGARAQGELRPDS